MSSRSLNEILIKIPTELFDFIFTAYNLRFILLLVIYICTQRDDACRIQQRCFIYHSIFAIPALCPKSLCSIFGIQVVEVNIYCRSKNVPVPC